MLRVRPIPERTCTHEHASVVTEHVCPCTYRRTRAADMGSVPICRPVLVPGPACMTVHTQASPGLLVDIHTSVVISQRVYVCRHAWLGRRLYGAVSALCGHSQCPDPEGLCFCVPAPSSAHTRLLCVCRTHSRAGRSGARPGGFPGLLLSSQASSQSSSLSTRSTWQPGLVTCSSWRNASVTITSKSSTGFGTPDPGPTAQTSHWRQLPRGTQDGPARCADTGVRLCTGGGISCPQSL